MLLSIIMPVYNLELYIQTTLDSCINQNIKSSQYEVICIDDGSTDKSLSILENYAKNYSNVHIISQKNSGVSSARNAGLKIAHGKYVWFVDGDDLIANNSIGEIASIASTANFDIIKLGSFKSSSRQFFHVPAPKNIERCTEHGTKKLLFLTNSWGGSIEAYNFWFRREFLLNNKIRFLDEVSYGEDTLFSFTAILHSRTSIRIDYSPYLYFQRIDSAMATRNTTHNIKYFRSMIEVAKQYKQITENESSEWKKIGENKANYIVHAISWIIAQSGDTQFARSEIKKLQNAKLYPYPILWATIKGRKNIKRKLISFLQLFLPIKPYLLFLTFLLKKRKKI